MSNSLTYFRSQAQKICEDSDFITTDGYATLARANPGIIYAKRDFVFRSGEWRGRRAKAVWRDGGMRNKTLVVGHSDLDLSRVQAGLLRALGIKRIRGINVAPLFDFAQPIPLGLTNDCDDSPLHRIFGNQEIVQRAVREVEPQNDFSASIYVNFSTATAPRERNRAINAVRGLQSVTFNKPESTMEGRLKFLRDMRRHNFVLAPSGNGVDTHRFWEALYVGSIPIVRSTAITRALSTGLPCVLVPSWDSLRDPQFLESQYFSLTESRLDANRLALSFWKVHIDSSSATDHQELVDQGRDDLSAQ